MRWTMRSAGPRMRNAGLIRSPRHAAMRSVGQPLPSVGRTLRSVGPRLSGPHAAAPSTNATNCIDESSNWRHNREPPSKPAEIRCPKRSLPDLMLGSRHTRTVLANNVKR